MPPGTQLNITRLNPSQTGWIWIWIVSLQGPVFEHHTDASQAGTPFSYPDTSIKIDNVLFLKSAVDCSMQVNVNNVEIKILQGSAPTKLAGSWTLHSSAVCFHIICLHFTGFQLLK